MKDLKKAKELLLSNRYTCVLCSEDNVYTSTERGVKPLVVLLDSKKDFKNYVAADKVVGKATAFLYVLLGIKEVYADVISKVALKVFEEHGIKTEYKSLVENIFNRQKDGFCPFESAVLDVRDPEIAYNVIREKMKEMNISI